MRSLNRLTWQDLMRSTPLIASTQASAPVKREPAAPGELLARHLQAGHWLLDKLPRVPAVS